MLPRAVTIDSGTATRVRASTPNWAPLMLNCLFTATVSV